MNSLVIVESPTKANTLSRFLGESYRIEATLGHIRDLPEKRLGIEIRIKNQSASWRTRIKNTNDVEQEYDFLPQYQISPDRKKRVKELKEIAQKAKKIILATDPDREGEAIAYHFCEVIRSNLKLKAKSLKLTRIVFHEITESAVKEALAHPRQINMQLVDAQQARRILDRLVGYKLSPLLWSKLGKNWLSAGRVQSVTVRLIVEREREIKKFKSEEYWTIEGVFKTDGKTLTAQLVKKNGVKYEQSVTYDLFDGKYTTTKTTIGDQKQAAEIIRDLKPPFIVSAVDRKEVRRFPPPPFTTSTLQQEAGRRFYFSSKKTMQLSQKLYEEGFITYHRTDSVNLSEKFIREARTFIIQEYGNQYIPDEVRRFKTKSKVAQEAHEAIRPTKTDKITGLKSQIFGAGLNKDHLRLYELIWKRALSCQAKEAIFDSTTINITDANNYLFETQGSIVKFDGFLKIIGREAEEKQVPEVSCGQKLKLLEKIPSQRFTNPPARYTEASLVKTLEEKGIGRPSTYAPIISTIQDRQYAVKEEKKFVPTELGGMVTDFLVEYFSEIMDLPFTAKMEDELDDIANGKLVTNLVLSKFYAPFVVKLEKAFKQAEKVKVEFGTTDEKCPQCGSNLTIRLSKYGKFLACSSFPNCKYTKNILEKIDIKCPRCHSDIVVKRTKKGKKFYGCSSYPKCTFAAWKKEEIR